MKIQPMFGKPEHKSPIPSPKRASGTANAAEAEGPRLSAVTKKKWKSFGHGLRAAVHTHLVLFYEAVVKRSLHCSLGTQGFSPEQLYVKCEHQEGDPLHRWGQWVHRAVGQQGPKKPECTTGLAQGGNHPDKRWAIPSPSFTKRPDRLLLTV